MKIHQLRISNMHSGDFSRRPAWMNWKWCRGCLTVARGVMVGGLHSELWWKKFRIMLIGVENKCTRIMLVRCKGSPKKTNSHILPLEPTFFSSTGNNIRIPFLFNAIVLLLVQFILSEIHTNMEQPGALSYSFGVLYSVRIEVSTPVARNWQWSCLSAGCWIKEHFILVNRHFWAWVYNRIFFFFLVYFYGTYTQRQIMLIFGLWCYLLLIMSIRFLDDEFLAYMFTPTTLYKVYLCILI